MAKFTVRVKEVWVQCIEVDADNEDDARTVAEEIVSTGVMQDGSELEDYVGYSYTLEPDEWVVHKQ